MTRIAGTFRGSLLVTLLCTCLAGSAHAVVFRAVATDLYGHYTAGSVRFGHASDDQEREWSTTATDYAAVAAVGLFYPQQLDTVYMTSVPFWLFDLQVWTSPGWSHGDVVLRIWVEDAGWPGQGWWRVDVDDGPGGGGFVVDEPGSAAHPQCMLTIRPQTDGGSVHIRLNQNPEPSSLLAVLTGAAGFALMRLRQRIKP